MMLKILLLFTVSALFLLPVFVPPQAAGRSAEPAPDAASEVDLRALRSDLRIADVAAYVDVKEVRFASRTDENTDCESSTKGGYCTYLLTAEVKEVFKGEAGAKTLEYFIGTEATFPRNRLLGERIVFLVRDEKSEEKSLVTIENSTRPVDTLAAMRKIADPLSPIDETDESDPYSFVSVKNEFAEADAVVLAEINGLRPDDDDEPGSYPFILKGEVKEVFKGSLKAGQIIKFKDDLLYRPLRNEDLGAQIVFLKREGTGPNAAYKRLGYSLSDVRHNIVEKLRKVARQRSNRKN